MDRIQLSDVLEEVSDIGLLMALAALMSVPIHLDPYSGLLMVTEENAGRLVTVARETPYRVKAGADERGA